MQRMPRRGEDASAGRCVSATDFAIRNLMHSTPLDKIIARLTKSLLLLQRGSWEQSLLSHRHLSRWGRTSKDNRAHTNHFTHRATSERDSLLCEIPNSGIGGGVHEVLKRTQHGLACLMGK